MSFNKNSGIPLYYQLKLWLLEQIEGGIYKPGEQIPTELELCSRFNISRGTVRRALSELIAEGSIYLVRGRGTFVSEPISWKDKLSIFNTISLAYVFTQLGLSFHTRLLEMSSKKADAQVAANLQIEPGEKIIFLKRLRIVESEPLVIITSYLSEKLASGLYTIDLSNRSLYTVLNDVCSLHISHIRRLIHVRLVNSREADLLKIPIPSAVYLFEELAYDDNNRPVEYSHSVFRGDKCHFKFHLKRNE